MGRFKIRSMQVCTIRQAVACMEPDEIRFPTEKPWIA